MSRCRRFSLILFVGIACLLGVNADWRAQSDEIGAASRPPIRHWAYLPIRRVRPPQVAGRNWIRGPIDAFVAEQLERRALAPSPEADRPALAKRLALALTGLPPTLDELDAFLIDAGPDSVERYVDRLLASPEYGERMSTPWLDLARYADTHGYHADAQRDMWRWRDWVIQAFNRNLPFDQFSIEQLAGDLLPAATLDQRIATGFNRNHMINFEDGTIDEEYRTEYVADRVATTATVWLAQTMNCARCHDHKHDPFTQRDYYRLFAYFNNVPERGAEDGEGNAAPFLAAPTPGQQTQFAALAQTRDELGQIVSRRMAAPAPGQDEWERRLRSGAVGAPAAPDDAILQLGFDEREGQTTWNEVRDRHSCPIQGDALRVPGKIGMALLFGGATTLAFDNLGDFAATDAFSVSVWVFPTANAPAQILARCEPDGTERGFSIGLLERRPTLRLTHDSSRRSLEVRSRTALPVRQWRHVTIVYDGSGKAAGVRMWGDGEPIETEIVHDSLRGSIKVAAPLIVGGRDPQPFRGMLDDLRLFARELKPAEAIALAGLNPLTELVAIPPDRRTAEQTQALRREFLLTNDPAFRDVDRRLRALNLACDQRRRMFPNVMVMQELSEPRRTHVLARGRFDQPGEVVTPGVPTWLGERGEPTRLGLARWLVSPDNPLTPRVAVNRFWHLFFAQGIVRTVDDFGTHGDMPSHPELLDWLAGEFSSRQRMAWDVKQLVRELTVSATFRQANGRANSQSNSRANSQTKGPTGNPTSHATSNSTSSLEGTPESQQANRSSTENIADADNRWLSRGPRPRLSAEMIRDSALILSGRFERRLGGPSVYPYQPDGLWEELAIDRKAYVPSVGRDLYRRSLYTFWKRAIPPPTLAILDAPDREVCTGARPSTTTPQQALVLLNDPTFVEAARGLAERALSVPELRSDEQRVAWMFRSVTARVATAGEVRELANLYADELRVFASSPSATADWLAVGDSGNPARSGYRAPERPAELAAMAMVAHVLLVLDENLTWP